MLHYYLMPPLPPVFLRFSREQSKPMMYSHASTFSGVSSGTIILRDKWDEYNKFWQNVDRSSTLRKFFYISNTSLLRFKTTATRRWVGSVQGAI